MNALKNCNFAKRENRENPVFHNRQNRDPAAIPATSNVLVILRYTRPGTVLKDRQSFHAIELWGGSLTAHMLLHIINTRAITITLAKNFGTNG
jgi:hypothetical protein